MYLRSYFMRYIKQPLRMNRFRLLHVIGLGLDTSARPLTLTDLIV